ncbi:hypothetical protein [uncultured Psychroserpens sp.]|uniref:hypothetical protein n=1 Tax=uncultured Psychroserpens sp. TaxID=255436 RepID=UPI0026133B21|nr:hypothetical protein [uncultured Psychroserpens sp.]
MKTGLSPKYAHKINDTAILWFHRSNRYVVVSESLYTLITLYFNSTDKKAFINALDQTLHIDPLKGKDIFNEISFFLEDANTVSSIDHINQTVSPSHKSSLSIERSYRFDNTIVTVHFESPIIESLIHPQIAHHYTDTASNPDIRFAIFKTNDDLHFLKNNKHIGSYKTEKFHFLQGKFALELTNAIHNLDIEKWIATFHGSTITNGKTSIMIVGDSGNGKSTLSALLMASGLDLLADDFTPLYEDLNLYSYPASISIKKGAFSTLEPLVDGFKDLETHKTGPKKVNLKYVPPTSRTKNSKFHCQCSHIVYVTYNKDSESYIKNISVEKILETLIPDSWISSHEKHARLFLDWLGQIKCYDLNYSDNAFAVSSINSLFNS